MGVRRTSAIVEERVYDNPEDTVNSLYDVAFPRTITKAIMHLKTMDNLENIVENLMKDIELIYNMLTNTIPGAKDYFFIFDAPLTGIEIIEGVWAPAQRLVWA